MVGFTHNKIISTPNLVDINPLSTSIVALSNAVNSKQISIFISHSWAHLEPVNQIDTFFKDHGIEFVRDKREITRFQDNIEEFMKRVETCDFVILMISEEFLKSPNCMYEVVNFLKSPNFTERVVPIPLPGTDIYGLGATAKYIRYWKDKQTELRQNVEGLEISEMGEFTEELKIVDQIKNSMGDFMRHLKNKKMVSFEELRNSNYQDIVFHMVNSNIFSKKVNRSLASTLQNEEVTNLMTRAEIKEAELKRYDDEIKANETKITSLPDNDSVIKIIEVEGKNIKVPKSFICPITLQLMKKPTKGLSPYSYEKEAIEKWVKEKGFDPLTNVPMGLHNLKPNDELERIIEEYVTGQMSDEIVEISGDHSSYWGGLTPFDLYDNSVRGVPAVMKPFVKIESLYENQSTKPYLEWLIKQHGTLRLHGMSERGISEVELEKVFVALKVDRTSSYEIEQSGTLLENEADFLEGEYSHENLEGFDHRLRLKNRVLQNTPVARAWAEETAEVVPTQDIITLAEVIRKERKIVMLGDPGSGKTTLAKWITMQFTRALQRQDNRILSLERFVDPENADSNVSIDLGPSRIPILLRVADFAEAFYAGNETLSLFDYLGTHGWNRQVPFPDKDKANSFNDLIKESIKLGQAVVILDGMDEIVNERHKIVQAIEHFIKQWIDPHDKHKYGMSPAESGGNQILITTRIAGYHQAPISGNLTRVFIEKMKPTAVKQFCYGWMNAYYAQLPIEIPGGLVAKSSQEADKLISAIYDDNNPRIRELVTNPLLITIIAQVFLENNRTLPAQRVQLYEIALKRLFVIWPSVKRSLSASPDKSSGFINNLDDLISILAPVASYIHERYSTGLIEESELKELLMQYVGQAQYPDIKEPQKYPRQLKLQIDGFVKEINEQVGILAARAEHLYGFLHLTFQEYLVGQDLIKDPSKALEAIEDRIYDPRWREAILLGLGHLNIYRKTTCTKILNSLINTKDDISKLFPFRPLLVVDALSEMDPSTIDVSLTRNLIDQLITLYSDVEKMRNFPMLKTKLESSLAKVHDFNEPVFNTHLVSTIEKDSTLASPIAALVRSRRWFDPKLIRPLQKCLAQDRDEWLWPIHTLMRDILSPSPTDIIYADPGPLPKFEIGGDWSAYKELKQRHTLATERYLEQKKSPQLRPDKNLISLPFKQQFSQLEQEDRDRVLSDPLWVNVMSALLGGYFFQNTPKRLQNIMDITVFLGHYEDRQDELVSLNFSNYVRWGYSDIPDAMKEYRELELTLLKSSEDVRFSPEAVYNSTKTIQHLIDCIESEEPATELIKECRQVLETGRGKWTLEDSAMILTALGENVVPTLHTILGNPLRQESAQATVFAFSRSVHLMGDTVIRSVPRLLENLKNLHNTLPEAHWLQLLNSVVISIRNVVNQPVDLSVLENTESPEVEAILLADKCFYSLSAPSDDKKKKVESLIAELNKKSSEEVCMMLSYAPLAPNIVFNSELALPFTHLELHDNPSDISTEMMDALHFYLDQVRNIEMKTQNNLADSLFDCLVPIVEKNRVLLPEILLFTWQENADKSFKKLSDLLDHTLPVNPIFSLFAMSRKIKDPYYRCRALLQFLPYMFTQKEYYKLLNKVVEDASAILDHNQQFQILCRTFPTCKPSKKPLVFNRLQVLCERIQNPKAKVQAYLSLLEWVEPTQKITFLADALKIPEMISDNDIKGVLLDMLRNEVQKYPDLWDDFKNIASDLKDGWQQAKVLNQLASFFAQTHLTPLRK